MDTYLRIHEICPFLVASPGQTEYGSADLDRGVNSLFDHYGIHRGHCCAYFIFGSVLVSLRVCMEWMMNSEKTHTQGMPCDQDLFDIFGSESCLDACEESIGGALKCFLEALVNFYVFCDFGCEIGKVW
jgi:hypothetical protein